MAVDIDAITERVREQSRFVQSIKAETARVIVGQQALIDRLLIGLLCDGHILIEGVPGLAKTLAVSTLARTIAASFVRIQFTPDLLPADITGTHVYHPQESRFQVQKGPIFANIVLADEVNRAPAKVQSALLEAMQERQVSIGGETFPLEEPFMVLATQNPIEHEGTYPLPEAQLDRFMLKVNVDYPSRPEEKQILERFVLAEPEEARRVAGLDDVTAARAAVTGVHLDERLRDYIVHVVYATRDPESYRLPELRPYIAYGASPRASIFLAQAARAHAFIDGRGYVTTDDVKTIAPEVLRHRIVATYEAEAEEIDSEEIARRVLDSIPVP